MDGIMDRSIRRRVVIGKDTRRSSYMFEYALAAGTHSIRSRRVSVYT